MELIPKTSPTFQFRYNCSSNSNDSTMADSFRPPSPVRSSRTPRVVLLPNWRARRSPVISAVLWGLSVSSSVTDRARWPPSWRSPPCWCTLSRYCRARPRSSAVGGSSGTGGTLTCLIYNSPGLEQGNRDVLLGIHGFLNASLQDS